MKYVLLIAIASTFVSDLFSQSSFYIQSGIQLADVTRSRRLPPEDNLYRTNWSATAGISLKTRFLKWNLNINTRYSSRMPLTVATMSNSIGIGATSSLVINGTPTHPRYKDFNPSLHNQLPNTKHLELQVIPNYELFQLKQFTFSTRTGLYAGLLLNKSEAFALPEDYGPYIVLRYEQAQQAIGVNNGSVVYSSWDYGFVLGSTINYELTNRIKLQFNSSYTYGMIPVQENGKHTSNWEGFRWKTVDLHLGMRFSL